MVTVDDQLEASLRATATALANTINVRKVLEDAKATDRLLLLNVAQFALLWNADLASLLLRIEALRGQRSLAAGWQSKQTARILALTILESCDTLGKLLGKDFRAALLAYAGKGAVDSLSPIAKELNSFRRAHDKHLREVRNTVIGHRDPDAGIQLKMMSAVDVDHIDALGTEMLNWNTRLFALLVDHFGPQG